MIHQDEFGAIRTLYGRGVTKKRIARELGRISRLLESGLAEVGRGSSDDDEGATWTGGLISASASGGGRI